MGEHAGRYPAALESFSPRILAKIADLWGGTGLDAYLDSLMLPERHDRQGFPAAVATELFTLATLHVELGFAPKMTASNWAAVEESARDGDAGDK
jgi:hypothetical protein